MYEGESTEEPPQPTNIADKNSEGIVSKRIINP
jgi:hypothetical protein